MTKYIKTLFIIIFGLSLSSMNIYDIKFEDGKTGKEINMSDFKGKVVMVVNTASLCGFTKQYGAMQELWDKYRDKGFILIGVPTNDFSNQEPGTDAEIHNFCELNFGINFIITKKVTSKGKNKHPFFKLVSDEFSLGSGPNWNFYKYVFATDGKPLNWYSPLTKPDSHRIKNLIETNLPHAK